MKKQKLLAGSLALTLALGTGSALAEGEERKQVIDNFTSAPLHEVMPQMPADWGVYYQATNVLGGVRQTNLIADDTLGASSRIDIEGGRLQVSTGIGSYFGAFLGYGYDTAGNALGKIGDFTDYDYFQIDFEANDIGLTYLIEVWDGDGTFGMLAGSLTTEAQSVPFSAELPLTGFEGVDPAGNPQDIHWDDIHYVIVYFQTASASGGNDFSVREVSVVDDPEQ